MRAAKAGLATPHGNHTLYTHIGKLCYALNATVQHACILNRKYQRSLWRGAHGASRAKLCITALERGIVFEISAAYNKPVIASHSNAYAICPVSRNLQDWQIDAIIASGGIIGINLFRLFLEENGEATLDSILRHIEYFLSRGAENTIAFGCDMDGADLPDDIPNLSHLDRVAEHLLAHGYSQKLIDNLFFENAYRFAQKHFR